MPYNRIIDPAGHVLRFGDPELENHTLDAAFIPGTELLAVEHRYGIALVDAKKRKITDTWNFPEHETFASLMSTFSGVQVLKKNDQTADIFWSAAGRAGSFVMIAHWKGQKLSLRDTISFAPESPSPMALPNELAINNENGKNYLYVVLNGNNTLVKIDLADNRVVWSSPTGVAPYGIVLCREKAFVTNWGGAKPRDKSRETAGVPYGEAYIDPKTGATAEGTVNVVDLRTGKTIREIKVGLHPNDLIASPDHRFVYVANGNSDNISVISAENLTVTQTISVKIDQHLNPFIGDSPNALALSADGKTLYVANGLDNALAVVNTGSGSLSGFIPTEAYPGGIVLKDSVLYVMNLEGEGARVNSRETKLADNPDYGASGAYNSHKQKATLSFIPVPDEKKLAQYTQRVKELNLSFRRELARLAPRKNVPPVPMSERIGEPSVFKHVIYIIKENRTYDQVLGDMKEGRGLKSLCIFGEEITPNQHKMAKNYVLLDNYYASGKCSAEGHQWTDAGMVTDYVEKSVRAWFRSYPHVQEDALVYDQKGFIWNVAADHGKKVRIYGEASVPHTDAPHDWLTTYRNYKAGKPFSFYNTTTISRVEPMLSQSYPGSDELWITDQIRADAFINELKEYEKMPGDQYPNLCVIALSTDHTSGTRPGMPTPRAMVADNDLALGRMIDALSKSRFWKSTVVFVTEDDSQAGWDHVSAYRTTAQVISPYSKLGKTVSTNYNQTSMLRSIEQILGIPPMNVMDATAAPMYDCFAPYPLADTYEYEQNRISLDEMNPDLASLKGKALEYAQISMRPEFDRIDRGNDALFNEILWHYAKGNKPYPKKFAGKDTDDEDD